MFDSVAFFVGAVLMSGTISNLFLNYIDEKYGVNTILWYVIAYLFLLLPMSIHRYSNQTDNCKNILEALKESAVTIGSVDILLFGITLTPVVGTLFNLLDYVPHVGTPLTWLASYTLYYYLSTIFKFLIKADKCTNISLIKALGFFIVSLLKGIILDFLDF